LVEILLLKEFAIVVAYVTTQKSKVDICLEFCAINKFQTAIQH